MQNIYYICDIYMYIDIYKRKILFHYSLHD